MNAYGHKLIITNGYFSLPCSSVHPDNGQEKEKRSFGTSPMFAHQRFFLPGVPLIDGLQQSEIQTSTHIWNNQVIKLEFAIFNLKFKVALKKWEEFITLAARAEAMVRNMLRQVSLMSDQQRQDTSSLYKRSYESFKQVLEPFFKEALIFIQNKIISYKDSQREFLLITQVFNTEVIPLYNFISKERLDEEAKGLIENIKSLVKKTKLSFS